MGSFLRDIRYAWRTLTKNPGFMVVAILTLALGIGANVAIFSIVYAILLRPLPFPQQQQLVRVFDDLRGPNVPNVGMSEPELLDLQNRSGVLQEISVVWPINADLSGGNRPNASKPSPPVQTISPCSERNPKSATSTLKPISSPDFSTP
jgi:hypothetical protein